MEAAGTLSLCPPYALESLFQLLGDHRGEICQHAVGAGRLNAIRLSSIARSPWIQPFCAAAMIIAYSPDT